MKPSLRFLDKCLLCPRHVLKREHVGIRHSSGACYVNASGAALGEAKGTGAVLKLADHSLCCFSAQQDSIKKANMKRENKAYSFKEQIIELELKEVSIQPQCVRGLTEHGALRLVAFPVAHIPLPSVTCGASDAAYLCFIYSFSVAFSSPNSRKINISLRGILAAVHTLPSLSGAA